MALQSEVSPFGEAQNTLHGDQKSEEDTEEDADLEEGEILDSGAEAEDEIDIKLNADSVKSSPKKSLTKSRKVVESAELSGTNNATTKPLFGSGNIKIESKFSRPSSERYLKKFKGLNYVDHDRTSGAEDNEGDRKKWFERLNPKKSRDPDESIDYRNELAAYRGSDLSSPEPSEKSDKKKKRKYKSRKLSEARRKKIIEKKRKRGKEISRVVRKPCKYWDEGHCHKGPECPYQHNVRFQKKEVCRYFVQGGCRKMKTCPFMHNDFPCKYFHTGAECYMGKACKFSHEPLTEEMNKILHDYLKLHHGDNYHHDKPPRKRERGRESTPIPDVPYKRVCLLGSPPRHIKEAEGTKRWQEEMRQLQREQKMDAFQIQLSFLNQVQPTNNRTKPNFYCDTLSSPAKSMPSNKGFSNMNNFPPPIMGCHLNNVNDHYGKPPGNHIPKDRVDWKSIQALVDGIEAPQNNSGSAQNGEMANNERGSFNTSTLYPNTSVANDAYGGGDDTAFEDDDTEDEESRDFKPLKISQEVVNIDSSSPKQSADESSSQLLVAELPDPDPIIIPNHLPRKQRELMLRIQKHQKLKSTTENDDIQIIEDKTESESDSEDIQIIETKDNDKKKTWDSSDDDEDDEPLTSVLQKLNQTPPPKPKELDPEFSLMISNIMQKANENLLGSVCHEQNKFWSNILSGTVPPVSNESASSMAKPNQRNPMAEEGNAARRVLLPNPEVLSADKPKVDTRDPRLKNRDPRMAAATVNINSNNHIVKPEKIMSIMPLPILPLDVSSGRHSVNPHHKDLNSLIPNQAPAAIVEGLQGIIPYRLREVISEPLNYSSYLQASHSDPKLLNDPRLRKFLVQGNTTPSPTTTEKFISSVPKPNCMLPNLPLFTNLIVETNPTQPNSKLDSIHTEMPSLPEIQLPQPQLPPKMSDPRTRRIEQRRLSGNNVPLPIAEPHIPLSIVPTFSKSSAMPTPASHLPRAMADPRMAKLHHPVDPRRTRTMSDIVSKVLKKQPLELKKPALPVTEPESQPSELRKPAPPITKPESQPQTERENKDSKPNATKLKSSQEKPKKNKEVHRNRKTSMDYASPLNSCDDSRPSDNLKYNSYTKRPRKPVLNSPSEDSPIIEIKPVLVSSTMESPAILEFVISENSNFDSDSMDSNLASLKDVFKTKDPTASPFC